MGEWWIKWDAGEVFARASKLVGLLESLNGLKVISSLFLLQRQKCLIKLFGSELV